MDDPKKPGRARTHVGDRNESRRLKTPPLGYPVHVDPEETPPPQLPPVPPTDALKDRIGRLEDGVDQLIQATGKVWDQRKDGTRFDSLDEKIASIASMLSRHDAILEELVVPGVKQAMAAGEQLARELPKLIGQIESLSLHINSLDGRVRSLETDVKMLAHRFDSSQLATEARLSSVEKVGNALDVRLTAVEQRARDEKVGELAIAESDRKRLRLARAGWVVAVAIISFLMSHLAGIKSLFTGG